MPNSKPNLTSDPGERPSQDLGERMETKAALEHSERLYRAIGESIDSGVWVCAPDGRNICASPSFLKLVGITQEKDRLSSLLNSISDEVWFADTNKKFTLANPAVLRQFSLNRVEETGVEQLAASLEVFRPDGSPRPVEEAPPLRALQGETVRDLEEMVRSPASGELASSILQLVAVRAAAELERRQAEAEVRRHAEELAAANEGLTRFSEAVVGRELRMIELKQEVNGLWAQLGQPPRAMDLNPARKPGPPHDQSQPSFNAETQRHAEKHNTLRISANLCVSALAVFSSCPPN